AEEADNLLAECGVRAGAVAIAEREPDRLGSDPVAAALVPEQVAPPPSAPRAAVAPDAKDVRPRSRDHADSGLRVGRRGPRGDDVVDDDPVGALAADVLVDGVGVGACDREHRTRDLSRLDPRALDRLVGD